MTVHLSTHGEELLREEMARDPRHSPEEVIEQALETLAAARSGQQDRASSTDVQRKAVKDMLDFLEHNRVPLGPGVTVKDLVHEGHRI
jgi:hypothetical protein